MRLGEIVNGYRITTKPTTSGGGQCVWAFAERAGTTYFIKQFLDPKWPLPESVGSEASKQIRREDCLEFEQRHRDVAASINPKAQGGGNLVTARDFFRHGTTYYKVTDRIEALHWEDLPALTNRQAAVILRTLALSLRLLHRAGFVHGDVKPANILIQRTPNSDLYMAKLIDFDDSYRQDQPPPPGQLVGDMVYGSPEWQTYVQEDDSAASVRLTTACDIFALGLVMHLYLAGQLPVPSLAATVPAGSRPATFASAGAAVRAGAALTPSPELHPQMRGLLPRMWAADPAARPAADDVFEVLRDDAVVGRETSWPRPTSLRIHNSIADRPAPAEPPVKPPGSRVRINFSTTES